LEVGVRPPLKTFLGVRVFEGGLGQPVGVFDGGPGHL
jgi:hypothetical protein